MSDSIRAAVRDALIAHQRVLLAVSGGLDSSVLLDAAAATVPADRLVVATFDHGTGSAASDAANSVVRRCAALGIACVSARAAGGERPLRTEADLREARWNFLRERAAALDARICTAHTADDQVETVFMRALRGAGARGLAGLAAPSRVLRPLLGHRRAELERYARVVRLAWTDDPTNESRAFLRNRVRRDILPALRTVNPGIDAELLEIGARAAAWRAEVEAFVDESLRPRIYRDRRWADVPVQPLASLDRPALATVWPAIAARVGATLDRRATERLADFAASARVGARAHLAGGWEVIRSRDHFELRPSADPFGEATPSQQPLSKVTAWGDWVFRERVFRETESASDPSDRWRALLPHGIPLIVRAWRAGDRLEPAAGGRARKVKELLTAAGVTGHRREGWPVVMAGDAIVWVPGIGRSEAATARPGRPGLVFTCEYISR